MPRRTDISSVLVIGSGPIVIGQACEFDYSGTQACRVLRDEGLRVALVNSNPATIMTDPEFADATYVEPITPEFVEKIIAKERPDALLATLGGQTALNTAVALHERGVLEKYGVELIGASIDAIRAGGTASASRRSVTASTPTTRAPSWCAPSTTPSPLPKISVTPWCYGRPSLWAAPGVASPTTRPSYGAWSPPGSMRVRCTRCWSRRAFSAGRSTSSRSCATSTTTASWSARSRTSTPWACTPATASPSRR